jgi:hypothetical protein
MAFAALQCTENRPVHNIYTRKRNAKETINRDSEQFDQETASRSKSRRFNNAKRPLQAAVYSRHSRRRLENHYFRSASFVLIASIRSGQRKRKRNQHQHTTTRGGSCSIASRVLPKYISSTFAAVDDDEPSALPFRAVCTKRQHFNLVKIE